MVPAIFYSGIFSVIYGLILSESLTFTSHDILMGFFLGVPQLAFGFICITIGSRTTPSTTIGLLMLSETLCAPIWVWLFLNEIPPLSVFIGGTVIILAIILKSFDKKSSCYLIIFDILLYLEECSCCNGRNYLNIEPKEQPPRKLSGKRTVTVITLESRLMPHRRIKSLRYIDRWG